MHPEATKTGLQEPGGSALLEVQDVHVAYGKSAVLHGVSLAVESAELVAILGRNGMGKTTLVHSLVGFLRPRSGSIWFRGEDITRSPSHEIVRRGVGLVPQGRRIFGSLSVRENLEVAHLPKSDGAWTVERVFDMFPHLQVRAQVRGGALSGGEKQMLAIGRALMGGPSLLVLDEPTEGLAPVIVDDIVTNLAALRASGLALLLVEQNLRVALDLADRVLLMSGGVVADEVDTRGTDVDISSISEHLSI